MWVRPPRVLVLDVLGGRLPALPRWLAGRTDVQNIQLLGLFRPCPRANSRPREYVRLLMRSGMSAVTRITLQSTSVLSIRSHDDLVDCCASKQL